MHATDRNLGALRAALHANASLSAAQLRTPIGCSQPTLSRLLGRLGGELAIIGSGPRRRYGLLRNVRGLGVRWPIFRITENGVAAPLGELSALHQDAFRFEADAHIDWLKGEFQDGIFPDFPWFLSDVRPQGFLGRALARRVAPILLCDADPRMWSADLSLHALLAFGADLSGDLVIGAAALAAAQNTVPQALTLDALPALAERALSGELIGSSAAGEQPKFSCWLETQTHALGAYLVKFSPPMGTAAGQRWADLLAAETIADRLLGGRSDTVDLSNRRFLISPRFDRVGLQGRRGLVSIGVIDAAYFGGLDNWADCAGRFEKAGWLSKQDAEQLRLRYFFGRAIGNTDMHFGNASLVFSARLPMQLAPSYDMLPMAFAPLPNGEVIARTFAAPAISRDLIQSQAHAMANQFWELVATDARISGDFVKIAQAVARC
jgi:hypothetical protein